MHNQYKPPTQQPASNAGHLHADEHSYIVLSRQSDPLSKGVLSGLVLRQINAPVSVERIFNPVGQDSGIPGLLIANNLDTAISLAPKAYLDAHSVKEKAPIQWVMQQIQDHRSSCFGIASQRPHAEQIDVLTNCLVGDKLKLEGDFRAFELNSEREQQRMRQQMLAVAHTPGHIIETELGYAAHPMRALLISMLIVLLIAGIFIWREWVVNSLREYDRGLHQQHRDFLQSAFAQLVIQYRGMPWASLAAESDPLVSPFDKQVKPKSRLDGVEIEDSAEARRDFIRYWQEQQPDGGVSDV